MLCSSSVASGLHGGREDQDLSIGINKDTSPRKAASQEPIQGAEAHQEDDDTDSEEGEEPSVKLDHFSKTEGSSSGLLNQGSTISDKRQQLVGPKRVRFNSTSKMVLIPCVTDYRKAGLTDTLWWRTDEYFTFQQAARSEIKMMAAYDGITLLEARRKLYQPEKIEEKEKVVLSPPMATGESDIDSSEVPTYSSALALRTLPKAQSLESFKKYMESVPSSDSSDSNEPPSRCTSSDSSDLDHLIGDSGGGSVGAGEAGFKRERSTELLDIGIKHIFKDSRENLCLLAHGSEPPRTHRPTVEMETASPSLLSLAPPCQDIPSDLSDSLFSIPGPEVPLEDEPKNKRNKRQQGWGQSLVPSFTWFSEVVSWVGGVALVVTIATNALTPREK